MEIPKRRILELGLFVIAAIGLWSYSPHTETHSRYSTLIQSRFQTQLTLGSPHPPLEIVADLVDTGLLPMAQGAACYNSLPETIPTDIPISLNTTACPIDTNQDSPLEQSLALGFLTAVSLSVAVAAIEGVHLTASALADRAPFPDTSDTATDIPATEYPLRKLSHTRPDLSFAAQAPMDYDPDEQEFSQPLGQYHPATDDWANAQDAANLRAYAREHAPDKTATQRAELAFHECLHARETRTASGHPAFVRVAATHEAITQPDGTITPGKMTGAQLEIHLLTERMMGPKENYVMYTAPGVRMSDSDKGGAEWAKSQM